MASSSDETRPLLAEEDASKERKPTPLPKGQIGILMLLHLAEPITSHCIYPFINQVSQRHCVLQSWAKDDVPFISS